MRGATAGDERCNCSNFTAARGVVTKDLQHLVNPPRGTDHSIRNVPVVPRDNDSTNTGFLSCFDIVDIIKAVSSVGSLELLSQIIVTDASGEHHGFWGEDVLN